MSQNDLRIKILSYLENFQEAQTEELAGKLYASRSTLRRVLIQLEEEGLVKRYYGGVRLVQSTSLELPVESRFKTNIKDKIATSQKAINLVSDNAVIFLDSSSTIYHFGLLLIKKFSRLNIITNGLETALALRNFPNSDVYLCPGRLRHNSSSIVGSFCEEFIENFHADFAFLSCKAIDKNGIYEGDVNQAHAKYHMIQQADKSYILCDQSKFYSRGYYRTANLNAIDGVICNKEVPIELAEELKKNNCAVY